MDLLDVAAKLEALAKEIRDSLPSPSPTPPPTSPAPPLEPPIPVSQPPINYLRHKDDYKAKWLMCAINPDLSGPPVTLHDVQNVVDKIHANAARYQSVAGQINLPYWQLIGIVHNLESGMDFTTHLHNGDPLTARTIHAPVGRPPTGNPPFTWEESAIDALTADQGWDLWRDWSIVGMGYILERYNGFGYRTHSVPSPYLWSGTNVYTSGRYVADGVFNPNSVSQQVGGMAVLKLLSG